MDVVRGHGMGGPWGRGSRGPIGGSGGRGGAQVHRHSMGMANSGGRACVDATGCGWVAYGAGAGPRAVPPVVVAGAMWLIARAAGAPGVVRGSGNAFVWWVGVIGAVVGGGAKGAGTTRGVGSA